MSPAELRSVAKSVSGQCGLAGQPCQGGGLGAYRSCTAATTELRQSWRPPSYPRPLCSPPLPSTASKTVPSCNRASAVLEHTWAQRRRQPTWRSVNQLDLFQTKQISRHLRLHHSTPWSKCERTGVGTNQEEYHGMAPPSPALGSNGKCMVRRSSNGPTRWAQQVWWMPAKAPKSLHQSGR